MSVYFGFGIYHETAHSQQGYKGTHDIYLFTLSDNSTINKPTQIHIQYLT